MLKPKKALLAAVTRFRTPLAPCALVAIAVVLYGQSIISGDVAGSVKDPSGAALPGATVTLKNVNTGSMRTATIGNDGQYRFSLIPPGTYEVTVEASGFQTVRKPDVVVVAGQPTSADFQLGLAKSSTTVDVSEAATAIQAENADLATVYNSEQVLNMPNPGGDLTYVAQTAPGVIMNTQSGYGNFSAEGMPATSNLFMINGQNFNDPYLNLNNSGASNLMLGFNDIAEANVVHNAYSAQYGQYAGSQVSYTTKSGTNTLHGDAIYMWNGRAMNANEFFNNEGGVPRPFLNFNQWATNVNGPVVIPHVYNGKNRTFFDIDYEGARVVLPSASTLVKIPSPQFQAATLANLASNGNAAEIPFYKQIFAVQNGAPGAANATPLTTSNGGCGTFAALGAGVPCVDSFRVAAPNKEKEYQWAGRVDHAFSDNDRAYIRLFRDNGYQPTYTDYFSPIFNAYSDQPQMSGQISESHVFNPTTVNQFNGSALFYSAAFFPSNPTAAYAALPTIVSPVGSYFSRIGGENYFFPQGRRVFQYQIIDDLTKTVGKHTFHLGFSWLHDDVTELGFGEYSHGRVFIASISEFFNGGGPNSYVRQWFPSATEQPLRFNTFGGYASDDWKVSDRLTLSLNLRLENYANPTCAHNCYSRLNGEFTGSAVDPSIPYNQSILVNQKNAYPNTPVVVWEPRVGIAWRPSGSDKTVIRTGAGIFADELPGNLAQSAAFNVPGLNQFQVYGNQLPSGVGAVGPGVPNSLFTSVAQANQALLSGLQSGATLASLSASVPGFVPPNFTAFPSMFKQPTYYKWDFEIQQDLGWNQVLSIQYAGMHGVHIPIDDSGLNAYCDPVSCGSFAGMPSAPADPRFGTIDQYMQAATSSYNGLTVSYQRRLSSVISWNANYTWSHALDVVSNGGIEQFNYQTNLSLLYPQNPYNIRANYGNADQDVRHYFSAGFVVNDLIRRAGLHRGPARIFGGWMLSGNIFYRTGMPFTVIDSNAGSLLTNYGSAAVFATPLAGAPTSCGKSAIDMPCFTTSSFVPSANAFGNQGRNSFRGPAFFDMDLAVLKDVAITERVRFSFGAQAFNVLNHPNFDQPVSDIGDPSLGSIISSVGTPTSILGAFVGGGNAPRFIEVKGTLRF
jgi:hypothetical protein